jgi:hypothetical protein
VTHTTYLSTVKVAPFFAPVARRTQATKTRSTQDTRHRHKQTQDPFIDTLVKFHALVCFVLFWLGLYCVVLYCIVLCCIVLYCIVLYCIVLYCLVLYCIAFSIVIYCNIWCVVFLGQGGATAFTLHVLGTCGLAIRSQAKTDSYLDSQLKQTAALLTTKTRCSSHVVNEVAH